MGCLKLTYRQEPDFRVNYSKKELTLKNSSQKVYRSYLYSFQAQEKDDEVKGSGNSYTTEYRQYDPRLGRWLSTDPLAGKQPDQSPYKSFLNNPLRYGDKEGDTEYETYIIKNKQTGEFVKIYKKVSNNVKTDFVRHGKEYHYYDYRHVTYLTINEDGSETVTKATEILYRNGMKDKAHVFKPYPEFGYANPDEIKIIKDPYEMKGGWYMTSKLGQGTKYYSKNPEYIGNIDDLISPLGGLKSGNIKKYFDRVKSIIDGIQKATEAVEPYLNDSSTSDEMTKEEQRAPTQSNTIHWREPKTARSNGGYRRDATPEEKAVGDTVGGNPDINLYPGDKGHRPKYQN